MKKIFIYIMMIFVVGFSSCDKFLEEKPIGSVNQDDYLNTKDDVERAIYSLYSVMLNQGTYGRYWPVIDVGTDDVGTSPTVEEVRNFASNTFKSTDVWFDVRGVWDQWWMGINRCNFVIDGITDVNLEDSYKSAAAAEAMCLRAFFYFQLVRAWGDVPIFTWFIEDKNISYTRGLNRAKAEQVYNTLIVPDLIYASEHAPSTQSQRGRATKWLAKTILSEVYATMAGYRRDSQTGVIAQGDQNNWTLARNRAWEVVEPGAGSPFRLITQNPDVSKYASAYSSIWQREYSDEAMLEIGALRKAGMGSWLTRECFTNKQGLSFWGAADSKPFAPEDATTVINMQFHGALNLGKYAPMPDLLHAMEPGDERRWGFFTHYYDRSEDKNYVCQPAFSKYVDIETAINKQGTSNEYGDNNFVIYRYVDAMLLFAEADNEVNGPTAEAISMINQIRVRAGLQELPLAMIADKETFREAIQNERRVELHAECKRRFDLIRWNLLSEKTKEYDTYWETDDNPMPGGGSYMPNRARLTYYPTVIQPATETVTQAPSLAYLLPLPQKELNLNKHWYNNFGY